MSILRTTSLPLTDSSSPTDLSAELDEQYGNAPIQLGKSSNSNQVCEQPEQTNIVAVNLSDSGSLKLDFLPTGAPKLTQEEKLRQFIKTNPNIPSHAIAEALGDRRLAKSPPLSPQDQEIVHAWICALMMKDKNSYQVAKDLLGLVPQNSPLSQKLFFSLLVLGPGHNKARIEELATTLIMKGLDLSSCHEKLGSPLHAACILGHLKLAKTIVYMPGTNLNLRDGEGFTAAGRVAEYMERYNESGKDMQELMKSFLDRYPNFKTHLALKERFKELAYSQGYIDNPYPPGSPSYKEYHAHLLQAYYNSISRPGHRKKKSSGSFTKLRLSSSKRFDRLPVEQPPQVLTGSESEIAYLKKRFDCGHYPSSGRVYRVFKELVENSKWKLVDELLTLLVEHGQGHYSPLLPLMQKEIENSPHSDKRKKQIQTISQLLSR